MIHSIRLGEKVMKIYSLKDMKLREFGALVLANNDESVKRALVDSMKGSGTIVEKYPEDFELHSLGEMDVETGLLEGYSAPSFVCSCSVLLLKLEVSDEAGEATER